MSDFRVAVAAALACFVGGCNVGPKYVPPAVVVPVGFKEGLPALYRSAPPGAWQPAEPRDAALKGKWWEIFHEPELDALESQLDRGNQTIAQYFQNFMAARAQVGEARAGYFPTLSVAPAANVFGGGRTAASSAVGGATGASGGTGAATLAGGTPTGSSTYTGSVFTLPLDASWSPDLWGRVRNSVNQARYSAQVSAADLENLRLTEQAALAEYYFQLRGQDSLQELYDRTIVTDQKALDLTRSLATTGIDSDQAVAQAEVTLENAQAAATGVATNRALYEHAIATLVGTPASSFAMPRRYLETPVPAIPLGIPSKLLERRPDIAAAERTMAAANALIGVEKAAYYPTVNLTGTGGLESTSLQTLFAVPAIFWSLGGSATETIFDGGLRNATVAQYVATYRADVAAYRQTVLTAFQQVEDYVATLRVISLQLLKQDAAVKSAQRYADIALVQYQTGLQPYLNVMTAQTILLGDLQTQVTLRVSQMVAAVQLVQALGGGWTLADLPEASKVTSKEVQRRLERGP